MIASLLLMLAAAPGSDAGRAAPLRLENEFLLAEFSADDGSIVRLRNKRKNLDLITTEPASRRAWALLLATGERTSEFSDFHVDSHADEDSQFVVLRWHTRHGITVQAQARLDRASDELTFTCSAENRGERTILALQYPVIQGIGPLSDGGARDRLLHSTAMGCLFRDPFHLFTAGNEMPFAAGMLAARYPNGFHGSSLQLMSYYVADQGGFYVATKDPRGTDKDFNFYKSSDRELTCEITHVQWDARAGNGLIVDYPIVVAALTEGTWYEAAERYRTWAVEQPWCGRGTRRARVERGDACRWLLEEIGAVGMWWPFRHDIGDDVVRTREFFGAPLLHLELWWQNAAAHRAAQSDGDRFGPFYFPWLALRQRSTFRDHRADQIVPPAAPISADWIAMCAAQPGWREVVCQSAEDMVGERPLRHHQIWMDENRVGCQADCLYYDIGPCAGTPTHCYAADHAHPPGAGRAITDACVSLFAESQRRASQAKGRYVPIGTECVGEPFVACLDLYYARTAGFTLDMEGAPFVRRLTWLPDGQMELVPLFPFVYHEYGPLAVQGIYPIEPWSVPAADDFFAWAEARTVLWGGLIVAFPLRAEVSIPERRAGLLRALVAARTGFARDYLAYGRMQRPPAIECGTVEIDHGLAADGWLRKVRFGPGIADLARVLATPAAAADEPRPSQELEVEAWVRGMLALPAEPAQSRTLRAPAVLCQAYTLGESRLGILLVNLRHDAHEVARVSVDPRSYGLSSGTYELRQATSSDRRRLAELHDRRTLAVDLGPSEVVLLEAVRGE